MADNEEAKETTSRGTEWEVVSLTESTYAAAPGPKEAEFKDDNKGAAYGEDVVELSHSLFMSGHFVFPPSQHENLPLEPENSEIHNEHVGESMAPGCTVEEGGRSTRKDEENWTPQKITVPDEFPGIQFFDEKGNRLSIHSTELEKETTLEGFDRSDKEDGIYGASTLASFHSDSALVGSTKYVGNTSVSDPSEPLERGMDLSADISHSPKPAKDTYGGPDLPCDAWWKRRAVSLYAHAREANTFWSIFIAAAVMGIVIIGQRWQQERWQALQLKWQVSVNSVNTGRMLGPISRLKDVLVGGQRRGSLIGGSSNV